MYKRKRIDYFIENNIIRQTVISFFMCISSLLICPDSAVSGPYLNSAHGNTSYGVNRSATATIGYTKGNCGHCHEQHASIGGSEPDPVGGVPSKFVLFYTNHTSQTDNFCFKCHVDISSYQSGGSLINRSYSYRTGGYTSDTLNDILEAFSFTYSPFTGSSHNLVNIQTLITGKSWGYTSDSNPCGGCHNPHMVKGDPANSPNSSKSSVIRGYSPVSRPSLHSKDNNAWGLWGDDSTERMSNYTANYQAPHRYGSTTAYEPDGSVTTDGSNLTDFVTFCTDCHNTSNTIYSTTLGRNLRTIDWNNEKHGKGNAEGAITVDVPYSSTMGYVLSCTDCHEPHGAPNAFLIRKEVNGGTLGATITTFSTTNWKYICARCHQEDTSPCSTTRGPVFEFIHHGAGTDRPYTEQQCGTCHGSGGSCPPTITCSNCHYHGSVVNTGIDYAPTNRRTF
jgi:hypothetical protein